MSGQAGLIRTNAFEIEGHLVRQSYVVLCVSQGTMKEMDSLNLKSSPALSLAWVATYRACGHVMTTVSAVKRTRSEGAARKRACDDYSL